jgi:hypothetical protein
MAEKSVDIQIADLEAQIAKLKAEKYLLEHPIQEYPKAIQVPDPKSVLGVPTVTIVVNSAAEEKAALSGHSAQHVGESAAQYDARVKAEAAAEKLAADKAAAAKAAEARSRR